MNLLQNQRVLLALAAVILLVAGAIVVVNFVDFSAAEKLRSPAELLAEASEPGDDEVVRTRRRLAARDLVRKATIAVAPLRTLAADSPDPAVRALALQGLGQARDMESVPVLLLALEDPDSHVRGQANGALVQIFEADFGFRADAEPAQRAASVKVWRDALGKPSPPR